MTIVFFVDCYSLFNCLELVNLKLYIRVRLQKFKGLCQV